MLLWDIAYPQVIVEHPSSDTLRYKVSLNSKWEEIVDMYLRETNSFKKDDGVISFEYCNDDGKETFVIGGIGTRKTLMQRIPSFYSLISGQVVLIYTGIEDKVQYSKEYIDELYKISFPRLYDNVSEITWKDPSRPNFKPVHGGISYDVEMWRIEMTKGKIVKKKITNAFLYSNE
jgi:hypothetical protein